MAKGLLGVTAGLLLIACACEPEATPLPVILPTLPSATTTAAAPQALRYALAPGAAQFLTDADRAQIASNAEIIPLDAAPIAEDLGATYDIVVALGTLADGTPAPSPLQVGLLLDSSLPPLDDPELALIVYQAVDPQGMAAALGIPPQQAGAAPTPSAQALRARLANAGYPDGFDLTLADGYAPGADTLIAQLQALNLDVRRADAPAHLTYTTSPPPDAIRLFTIPIRYRAVEGLTITFTPSGFPVAQRPLSSS